MAAVAVDVDEIVSLGKHDDEDDGVTWAFHVPLA